MQKYLESSEIIDWRHPEVSARAKLLASGADNKIDIARRCFEFVRDEIRHSVDAEIDTITISASDVLLQKTGLCYTKSHLLAALLRTNGIPAALVYQRLCIEAGEFCLHGLNAIWLDELGWYRVDARGNKPGVSAQFMPPHEQLAFALTVDGEIDSSTRHAAPLQCVVDRLRQERVASQCLPDDINLD